ncbi:YceI family protein [Deminuibacter soli]|uniref:YceI family protein n=1 Tax=Deminuibacter soli TaxID=2291815 RepID=A0A3E1NI74_9BACT|nr:YceI family protein [Deminuibacter soli]RFM27637.1 YceI family protein [Deminuibacter soli]
MKRTLLAVSAIIVLASCGSNTDKAATAEKQEAAAATGASFTVDTASTVGFRATHKGGVEPHDGLIKVQGGTIAVDGDKVTGGSITIAMATLKDLDITDTTKKGQLEGHLKSPDFFDVAKYPTAKFEITKVAPYDSTQAKSLLPGATHLLSGNLTLKDSTVNLTFPAKITITGKAITAEAKFTVDRTTWGLNYKGPNNAQDWLISKDVDLTLNLNAKM